MNDKILIQVIINANWKPGIETNQRLTTERMYTTVKLTFSGEI